MIQVLEPATEEVMAEVPRAGADEVDAAVAAARAAFPAWRAIDPPERAAALRRLADALEGETEDLAVLEARNAGKPIGDARDEMGMVVETFRYYAGAPERLLGHTIPVAGGVDMTFREPLGVVGLIVPWNFPLVIASWKVAPALAAGNTIVLKPAELTPLTALELERIALEAGLPEGVLNVVAGPGSVCGRRLVEHPDVAKIAFTGSTEVGRTIARGAADTIKRVTLELGGKSANVVFADADLERAAAAAPMAVFGNSGQDCCARSRILVERGAMDDFVALLGDHVRELRVGDPLDEATQMGPLISRRPAGQRGLLRGRRRPGGRARRCARRPRLLVSAHGLAPVSNDDRRGGGGDLRPGGVRDPASTTRPTPCARPTTHLRTQRIGVDQGRRQGHAHGAVGTGTRRAVGELEQLGAGEHALRRLQAVGGGPRARAARARAYTDVKNVYFATEEG